MNIAKVKNSAAIVNYVKPGIEMVEIEIEGSLLLTTSNTQGNINAQGLGSGSGSVQITNGGNYNATRRN